MNVWLNEATSEHHLADLRQKISVTISEANNRDSLGKEGLKFGVMYIAGHNNINNITLILFSSPIRTIVLSHLK